MVTQTAPLTIEEFVRLYDQEGPFEIINGERVPVSPIVFGHGFLANWLARTISNFSIPLHLGDALAEMAFILPGEDNPNWVKGSRVPDVMFIKAERLAAYKEATPNWRTRPLALVPDLVVEIISPTDSYTEVNNKVERYIADGVQLVWVLDPQRKSVLVRNAGSSQQTLLSSEDMLTGGEIIPGFQVKVADLFEQK